MQLTSEPDKKTVFDNHHVSIIEINFILLYNIKTMNLNKSKNNRLTPILIIFCVVYFILSVRPMKNEINFTPEWTVDISRIHTNIEDGQELIPYKLSQNLGYFTEDGKVYSSVSFPFKSSISKNFYTLYGSGNTDTTVYSVNNEKLFDIKKPGFPFFSDDRIFIMQPGGNSFCKYTKDGNFEWEYENYSPITAFAAEENGTVVGYADGTIVSFDKNGKIDQEFFPGGSKYGMILGAGISADGKKIACVSGQDKQRFVVAEKSSSHSKIIYHEYLENELTRQTLVKFSRDSNTVYFNYADGLGIVDLRKCKNSKKIKIQGKISQIEFLDDEKLVFVLSKNGNTHTVTVLEDYFYKLASFSFQAESSFIQTKSNSLYVGSNNKISRILINRK